MKKFEYISQHGDKRKFYPVAHAMQILKKKKHNASTQSYSVVWNTCGNNENEWL